MLEPGAIIGPYRIEREIGRGGMGVVFLARDTRLDRPAAIKALPEEVSADPERLARFEREAKTLASLSHPNIAAIYGVELDESRRLLALEYVEGESLLERIARGPIPPRELIEIAIQLAAGIEAAHESGVIHRDLKPGNVMLARDGRVKILDFGLAKGGATETPGSGPPDPGGAGARAPSPTISHSPTFHSPATLPGVILGTAAYLSPEQARGKTVDRRADIWAFGCILYECLTGRPAFEGETVSDVIARILEREPDLGALPAGTPPPLRRLVARCLRKDPRDRLRDIGDARLALAEISDARDGAAEPDSPGAGRARERTATWAWAVLALFVGAFLVLSAIRLFVPSRVPGPVRKFALSPPQFAASYDRCPRISPDGRRIVYASGSRLYVRDLQSFAPAEVPGSENGYQPFWSADGTQLCFAKDEKLWVTPLAGGQNTAVCAIPGSGGSDGGCWTRDGEIVFSVYRGGLYEVPARGGDPRLLLTPDSSEVDFHFPEILPDDRHVLFVAHKKTGPPYVSVISRSDGRRKDLKGYPGLETAAYSKTGHLLLNFDVGRQQILAVPFSAAGLRITGEPFTVVPGGLYPSVSENGTLTYFLGSSRARRELVWLDHSGRLLRVVGQPGLGLDLPAVSPDGRKAAVMAYESDNADIWIQDLARGTRSRLASAPQDEDAPAFADGGRTVLYCEEGNVDGTIKEVAADGSGGVRIRGAGYWPAPTPDGRSVVCARDLAGRSTLWRLDAAPGSKPVLLTPEGKTNEDAPALSPDGRWLAFWSDESGAGDVFVRRFTGGTRKQQVSLDGGEYPFWSPDGGSLYYWRQGALVEVPVQDGAALTLGAPKTLFTAGDAGIELASGFRKPPVAAASGGRFLAVRRAPGDPMNGVLVVENWLEEFRKR